MLGDREQKNPGIIPRTFTRIFEIIQENETKFEFKVIWIIAQFLFQLFRLICVD